MVANSPGMDMRAWSRRRILQAVGAGSMAGLSATCAGPGGDLVPGEKGRVVRVSDGDLIALDTGLRVRLAEIEAPSRPYRDRRGEPYADEAAVHLENAVLGRPCQLFYGGLTRDGYGRAIAHVIASDELGNRIWANGLQIRQGAARVRTWPDNSARVGELLALEDQARTASRGLWTLDAFAPCKPLQMIDYVGRFALVEGAADVLGAGEAEEGVCRPGLAGGLVIDLGARLRRAASVQTPPSGVKIRVRGRVLSDENGQPMIKITHWPQIELLEALS